MQSLPYKELNVSSILLTIKFNDVVSLCVNVKCFEKEIHGAAKFILFLDQLIQLGKYEGATTTLAYTAVHSANVAIVS